MPNETTFKKFLYQNAYLIVIAFWLITFSFIVDNYWSANASVYTVQKRLSHYVQSQERDFNKVASDSLSISKMLNGTYNESFLKSYINKPYFLFAYKKEELGSNKLVFWNTQLVQPFAFMLYGKGTEGFEQLENGYYVWNKVDKPGYILIALIPIKWNYIVSMDYLKNDFVIDPSLTLNYDISSAPGKGVSIESLQETPLFWLYEIAGQSHYHNNALSIAFRILAALLIILYIHLCANYLATKKRWVGVAFFGLTLLVLRILSYVFPIPMNFRQFELFNPAVYGSNAILRSLGDLLINAVLFLWFILFLRNHIGFASGKSIELLESKRSKWLSLSVVSLLFLVITYASSHIVRSLVADSQISFDVINFFSLNVFSAVGFLVLSCITITFYFIARMLVDYLNFYFPKSLNFLYLFVAVGGLTAMSIAVMYFSSEFELYVLLWLLLFLYLLNNRYLNSIAGRIASSLVIFWIFFFSVSISMLIIVENTNKELRSRKHYAEILSTKSDPSNETLLNSMLTDFRISFLVHNYSRLQNPESNHRFKDSIINSNFSGYTNKYETKIYTFNAEEQPLYNTDPASYTELNSILKTQSRPTGLPDLFYYDESYDRFSYISKKTLTDTSGSLLGYVFVVASPRKFKTETFSPELFSRKYENSIENSSTYAFAIYSNGKLIASHNDYPFATLLKKNAFPEKEQFFTRNLLSYNELWYRAGPDKMVVIAKPNHLLLESVTLFSYLFCSFLVLAALFWFIIVLVRSGLKPAKLKSYWQLTIRGQIHGTIILVSVLSFFIIGGATIYFFVNRYESNNREKLSRAIHIMEGEVKDIMANGLNRNTSLSISGSSDDDGLGTTIRKISEIHGVDVNVYDLHGNLFASSLPLPYVKGVLSSKMDPMAYYHMNHNREVQYFQKERIGDLVYVSDYIPVIDAVGNNYAYLNIPYFTSESNLKNEISNFVVTIINLNAFIFILAGIIALFIATRITDSFSVIAEKMKQVNIQKSNEYIEWDRDDELKELVTEYNKMVSKLDESVKALTKSEREEAWRTMARQVAHEIKNPLTPMKLSMQFLQKAIDNNAPNIKELTSSVASTLIEQIDHLSQIAGDFSQFANIENSKNEFFDVNEALKVTIQLFASTDRLTIVEHLHNEKIIIEADRTHINRLFSNLILNALQATPEDKIATVHINEDIQDDKVTIQLSDNGSGIPEEIRDKIFTPNFTTKSLGTGLGLAMCRRIVEKAKGKIWFETGEQGTTFFVELPIAVVI